MISWFNRLILSYRGVLIGICTWILNNHLNWNFIFRTIWVSDDNSSVFFAFCCCVNRCLVLELSAFWKISDVANGILSIWLVAWFNRLIFGYRCILIGICTWVFDCYLNWNLVFRTVWVSDNNSSVFVTFCCCINWCLVLELSTFWKVTYVANGILSVWLIAWFNRLIFSCWCVLIRICAWLFNSYLNWNFVFRTVWVSDNNSSVFVTFCCCINWCLVLELSTFWKVTYVANGILSVWLIAWFNRLIFSCWCVLIRICAWLFNSYLNWNFVFRTVWVCYDNSSVFVTFCCCVNRCLVFEGSAFWKITNIAN